MQFLLSEKMENFAMITKMQHAVASALQHFILSLSQYQLCNDN